MSAYIVDRMHIRYLVCAAQRAWLYQPQGCHDFRWYHDGQWHALHRSDKERASQVGQMLWDENVRSVSHRYPGESTDTLPGPADEFPYAYGEHADLPDYVPFNVSSVLSAIDCLDYQSCETEDWQESESCAFLRALERIYTRSVKDGPSEWGAPRACYAKTRAEAVALNASKHSR